MGFICWILSKSLQGLTSKLHSFEVLIWTHVASGTSLTSQLVWAYFQIGINFIAICQGTETAWD
jgi:hypothetical protein